MDALKQSYMDCSANFLTENERESRRMTEGFLRLSGEHPKNDHFCFLQLLFPPFPATENLAQSNEDHVLLLHYGTFKVF